VLALWIGGIALFTFITTPVIFTVYSRDLAGDIVGQLFPGYFLYNLILSLIALVLFVVSSSQLSSKGVRFSFLCLALALCVNIFVYFKLHPEIKLIKAEIHSFETVPNDSLLRKKFKRLHGVSAALNLLLLADGVALLLIGVRARQ
jgi:ABC-type transport system involved in multi-copper enzyme maturation permease subunit